MPGALFALARSAVFGSLFITLWIWLVPHWIASAAGLQFRMQFSPGGVVLLVCGAVIVLWCIWEFAWTGRGTPAPFDPPRRLVIRGPYRFVRNPMYLGLGVFLAGEALSLRDLIGRMFVLIAVLWMVVTVFVVFYEEPALRRLFGADYADYCRNVRRWIPRLTPFDKRGEAAVLSPDLD